MRFFKPHDINELNEWLRKWDVRENLKGTGIPPIGFIEPGVAAGFLVQTDSDVCFLDLYVNNPNAKKEKKRKAEKEITQALINQAQAMGYKRIVALTKNDFISYRAQKVHKFKKVPQVQYLELGV